MPHSVEMGLGTALSLNFHTRNGAPAVQTWLASISPGLLARWVGFVSGSWNDTPYPNLPTLLYSVCQL